MAFLVYVTAAGAEGESPVDGCLTRVSVAGTRDCNVWSESAVVVRALGALLVDVSSCRRTSAFCLPLSGNADCCTAVVVLGAVLSPTCGPCCTVAGVGPVVDCIPAAGSFVPRLELPFVVGLITTHCSPRLRTRAARQGGNRPCQLLQSGDLTAHGHHGAELLGRWWRRRVARMRLVLCSRVLPTLECLPSRRDRPG